ncbi:MAG: hypothetical protein ABIG20_00920 [archaeon]
MGEKEELANLKKDVINIYSTIPEMMGINRALGVIWATLAFEGSLTMAELSEKTGYSLSTLSPYLKTLDLIGRIEIRKEGKVTKYQALTSMREIMDKMMASIQLKFSTCIAALKQAEAHLNTMKKTEDVKNTLEVVRKLREEQEGCFDHMMKNLSKMPEGSING